MGEDVSGEGTLVWLRRPNGTWWPSIVISPLDVPEGCPPPPPRCPAVPIMLLGRRDGATYVDWCNVGRCKRVKPFRCGELDFDQRIARAQAVAAARIPIPCKGRYARMEDAVLQALEIERAREMQHDPVDSAVSVSLSPKRNNNKKNMNTKNKKKRKTPNDAEDDAKPNNKASRRMRDLSDCHLPHSPHNKRKKDRSRPLSELCDADSSNGFGYQMGLCPSSPSSSSPTSSFAASSFHKTCCSPSNQARVQLSFTLSDDDDDHLPAAPSTLQQDHWPKSQPCAPPKLELPKQSTECSKGDLSFQCDRENSKMKTIGSVHQEGSNRTRNVVLGHKHHKTKALKQKAPRNEAVHSEKKPAKLTLNKPSEPGDDMHLAADLGCVDAVQQQHSDRNHDLGDSSGTISSSSNCENGSVSSLIFELPLQALPSDLKRCHAVKPMKTLQLNPTLCDVELSSRGTSNNGRRVPLVSLMSKWNHKPVVGYPITVEVLDDVLHYLLSNTGDHQPDTSTAADASLKKDQAGGLPPSQACRAKPKSRKKTSGKEGDKLWLSHTKKPASSSPRKMRRLSSFASSRRDGDAVVGKISGSTVACIPLRVAFSRIKEVLRCPAS